MTTPLHITFLGMPRSPSVEAQVQRLASKLEKSCDRITKCSTWIEQPHRHSRKGNSFRVRVEVAVPGAALAVTDREDEQAHVAIAEAFRAMRARLA